MPTPPPGHQPVLRTRLPAPRTTVFGLVAVLVATLMSTALVAGHRSRAVAARSHDQLNPRLRIAVLPPVRHPSDSVAPSSAARSVVTVTLSPKRIDQRVTLQRRYGSTWRTIATKTIRGGTARFPVTARDATVYRAVLPAHRGLPAISSNTAVDDWGGPDFVDEFDGTSLGPAWAHRVQFHNPWGGRACSKGSPDAVSVGDGVLRLSSMPDPAAQAPCPVLDANGNLVGYFPYRLNANVSTQYSADFLYGVAATRMRFPRSPGQHAAFWLQPRGLLETGPTPWGAEIDVIEWYGARGGKRRMASVVHAPMPDGSMRQFGGHIRDPDRFLATRADSWWDRFHVFSVEWTPAEYVFRIDGHEVWRTRDGVTDVHEFMILSMLSSDYELPLVGNDPNPRTAEVDWVAFWQR